MQVYHAKGSRVSGRYYEQINTLRFFAICFVFAEHWMYSLVHPLGIQGSYGVWMFFTISGFLITGILLNYNKYVDKGSGTIKRALGVFYMRRFLRIFPAYYLFLALALLVGPATAAAGIWWHVSYISNLYFLKLDSFASLGHLWSLAVEEQFYLGWPLVLLLLPKRTLVPVIITGVFGAVLFRFACVYLGWGMAAYVVPLACFDTLGLGALLALLREPPLDRRWLNILTKLGIGALGLWPFIGFASESIRTIVSPLVVGMASVFMIDRCVRGVRGPIGRLLVFPPFLYLGQISYGLYLYHSISGWMIPAYIGIGSPGGRLGLAASATARLALVVGIAAISWHFFERPINNLKRHWTLRPPPRTAANVTDPDTPSRPTERAIS